MSDEYRRSHVAGIGLHSVALMIALGDALVPSPRDELRGL